MPSIFPLQAILGLLFVSASAIAEEQTDSQPESATPAGTIEASPGISLPPTSGSMNADGEPIAYPWDSELAALPQEPDIEPPPVNGWLDASLMLTDFSGLGIDEIATGYRFSGGFLLEPIGDGRYNVSLEVGYARLGRGQKKVSVDESNPPGFPNFIRTTTTNTNLDASSLDFGGRLGIPVSNDLEAFVRAGLGFFHVSREIQDTFSYRKITPNNDPDIDPSKGTTASFTESGLAPYGSVGIARSLGPVPMVYGECFLRMIDGDLSTSLAVGVMLDF